MRSAAILLPLCLMLAAAALVVSSQMRSDPLAPFRGTDGRLTIPGSALTPELQRLLFGGDQLLPSYELMYVSPERSSYPTVSLRSISFEVPNLNVFVHPKSPHETLADSLGHLIRGWFPPVDWHQVGVETLASVRHGIGWVLDLFTMNARADTLTVDSTTVAVVDPAAGTCTTSQSAAAGDNAVLVMLSNRGPTAYTSVTYGAINLSLIPGTASSGTGFVRTEMWFYQGAIPGGAQTMTATLVSGTAKHVCATVLLGGCGLPLRRRAVPPQAARPRTQTFRSRQRPLANWLSPSCRFEGQLRPPRLPARERRPPVSTGLRRLSARVPARVSAEQGPICLFPERRLRGRTATPPTWSSPRSACCPFPTAGSLRETVIGSARAERGTPRPTGRTHPEVPPAGAPRSPRTTRSSTQAQPEPRRSRQQPQSQGST